MTLKNLSTPMLIQELKNRLESGRYDQFKKEFDDLAFAISVENQELTITKGYKRG